MARESSESSEATVVDDEQTPLLSATASTVSLKPPRRVTPLPKLQIGILLFVQVCEPLSSQVIYPFIAQLVSELDITGGDERKVGYYAGLIESLFFATEACTVLHWSRISDFYGRKIIILIGLCGLGISMLCFGLSRTFWRLVVSRCISGMLNGNIGVMKSMMGEITDSTNRAAGFALMPSVWGVGATLGPLIGGTLARPHDHFPRIFSHPFWQEYPYFLPCAIAASFTGVAIVITTLFLKETVHRHKDKGHKQAGSEADPQTLEASASPRRKSEPVALRELLVFPVLISISNYFTLAFLDITIAALRPLFLALPIEIGGLGQTPSTIGLWLGAYGLSSAVLQGSFFAKMVTRFGVKRIFTASMAAFIPIFALFPLISFIAQTWGISFYVWALVALQFALSIIMDTGFGCVFMYITTAAPNKRSLGATHGLSQTSVSFMRAIGPASATSLFSFSVEHNILGGYAVYALLIVLSIAAQFLVAQLPADGWPEDEEEY